MNSTTLIPVADGTTLRAYLARPASDPAPTGVILYLVGEDDALIDAGQREQIRAALESAGVKHELVSYPGVGHAFFWPGTPPYSATARADAWGRVLELLAS